MCEYVWIWMNIVNMCKYVWWIGMNELVLMNIDECVWILWICVNMETFVWICVNMDEYVWWIGMNVVNMCEYG